MNVITEISLRDPERLSTLMDDAHIIGIINIHTISCDLATEYDKMDWTEMRKANMINGLTGKSFLRPRQLKRLKEILKTMWSSPEGIACYVPHEHRPFFFFPLETCELLFAVAPVLPYEAEYKIVPINHAHESKLT